MNLSGKLLEVFFVCFTTHNPNKQQFKISEEKAIGLQKQGLTNETHPQSYYTS